MEEKNEQADSIKEAEVIESEEKKYEMEEEIEDETKHKKRKTDFMIELVLFFILGVLIGIAVKGEAVKRFTMGFDDYKMKIRNQDYNINNFQADLVKKQAEESVSEEGIVPEENANPDANPEGAVNEGGNNSN